MIDDAKMRKSAAWFTERGLSVFPLLANDKRPAMEWSPFRESIANASQIASWSSCNLGLATGRLSRVAVIDCESRQDAEWFVKHRSDSPVIVQTTRGYHLYFRYPGSGEIRNAAKVTDEGGRARYDIRGEGGYVVAPPSTVGEWTYQFVFGRMFESVDSLPEFNPDWCPKQASYRNHSGREYTDAFAYISKIQAVSGQAGHNDTWRAVSILRDAGVGETEALAAMSEWNRTNADPEWSMPELLHKVKDCYGRR